MGRLSSAWILLFLVEEIKFDIRKKHMVCGCEREGGWVSEGGSWVRVSAYVYTCVCIYVDMCMNICMWVSFIVCTEFDKHLVSWTKCKQTHMFCGKQLRNALASRTHSYTRTQTWPASTHTHRHCGRDVEERRWGEREPECTTPSTPLISMIQSALHVEDPWVLRISPANPSPLPPATD